MDICNIDQVDDSKDNFKWVEQNKEKDETSYPKKLLTPLSTTATKHITQLIIVSNIYLPKHEIKVLKLGLFYVKPKHNVSELETDIYSFIRKLSLNNHFCYSTCEDKSIVKNASTFAQNNSEN